MRVRRNSCYNQHQVSMSNYSSATTLLSFDCHRIDVCRIVSKFVRVVTHQRYLRGFPLQKQASLAGCLPQSCQRRLVIKDCLIQSSALLDQRCLRVRDLDYLSFTSTVTRDRCCQIVLRFDYTFARETNPGCSTGYLRVSGVKLLREPA